MHTLYWKDFNACERKLFLLNLFIVKYYVYITCIYIGGTLCSTLTAPLYGQVSVKALTPDSCANYTCNEGFTLIGDHIRVCLHSGEWTGNTPTCQSMIYIQEIYLIIKTRLHIIIVLN